MKPKTKKKSPTKTRAARGRRLDMKPAPVTETEADRQALLPGFARAPSSPHAMPDDGHPTVMTIRATKGEVRAWVRAASSAGFTFPMPWARHILRNASAVQS